MSEEALRLGDPLLAAPIARGLEARLSLRLAARTDVTGNFVLAPIVGTRGLEDPSWLIEQAALAPGRIILAADVRDRAVVAKGWTTRTTLSLADVISELAEAALAGLLVTAVHKEGKMEGTDLPLIEEAVRTSPWPVIASGGVGSMQDLRNLEDREVAAVVLGMSLYTEAIDARVVAEEFAA